MNDILETQEPQETIDFEELISALLNNEEIFSPRYLSRLSDLNPEELALLKHSWPNISDDRRKALLEDLEELSESNTLMLFENIFIYALEDINPFVRKIALRALWETEDKSILPKFIALMENDPEEVVRSQAASSVGQFIYLGEIGKLPQSTLEDLVNKLFKILNSEEERRIQMRALESLGFSSDARVPELIEDKFDFGDEEWITSAIIAMGRSNDDQWHAYITDKLDHSNNQIRLEATKAVGTLEIHDADSLIIHLTNDDDDEVRMAAAWSLSEIGGDDAQNVLDRLLENTDDDEELDLIQAAMDNLAFNQEMGNFSLLDFSPDDPEEIIDEQPSDEG